MAKIIKSIPDIFLKIFIYKKEYFNCGSQYV